MTGQAAKNWTETLHCNYGSIDVANCTRAGNFDVIPTIMLSAVIHVNFAYVLILLSV